MFHVEQAAACGRVQDLRQTVFHMEQFDLRRLFVLALGKWFHVEHKPGGVQMHGFVETHRVLSRLVEPWMFHVEQRKFARLVPAKTKIPEVEQVRCKSGTPNRNLFDSSTQQEESLQRFRHRDRLGPIPRRLGPNLIEIPASEPQQCLIGRNLRQRRPSKEISKVAQST
jgi:hypothetical protein